MFVNSETQTKMLCYPTFSWNRIPNGLGTLPYLARSGRLFSACFSYFSGLLPSVYSCPWRNFQSCFSLEYGPINSLTALGATGSLQQHAGMFREESALITLRKTVLSYFNETDGIFATCLIISMPVIGVCVLRRAIRAAGSTIDKRSQWDWMQGIGVFNNYTRSL